MKNVFLSLCLFVLAVSASFGWTDYPDYDFESYDQQVAVAATSVVRVTHTRTGILFIAPVGGDIRMAFNATANASSWPVSNGDIVDWHPLGVELDEYITIYNTAASTVTVNVGVYD